MNAPLRLAATAIASLPVAAALAATPGPVPPAGAQIRVLQDETRQQLRARDEAARPDATEAPTRQQRAAQASDARLHVESFEVHGVTRFTADEVAAVLAPFTGRDLDTGGLHEAADALNRHYRLAGWFAARVFLPPQTTGGAIRLDVYEGWLEAGGLEISNASTHVTTEAVRRILDVHLRNDRPMHRAEFERALLLIEDLPGVRASSTLYPGVAVGTARLLVSLADEPGFAGNVDFDNYGNVLTGRERLGSTLYFNAPGGVGDQVVARVVTSGRESSYGYLTYLRPVSPHGTRLGASLDAFRYSTDANVDLGRARGTASELRLYATHPFLRARHENLHGRAEFFQLRMKDRNDVGTDSHRRVSGLAVTVGGDEDRDWIGNGTTTWDLAVIGGRADIRGDAAFRLLDESTARLAGRFARATFTATRLQHLGGDWSALGRVGAQLASRNLDSSQRFYLGGGTTLSGYPVGEASGDEGVDLHAELRRAFRFDGGHTLLAGAFVQQGWLKQHETLWPGWNGRTPELANSVSLGSAGLVVHHAWRDRWVLRGHVAWQLGSNPLRDPRTGAAGDGSSRNFRAWIQAIHYF